MLRITEHELPEITAQTLAALQLQIDRISPFEAQVDAAKKAWANKASTRANAEVFQVVRQTLARMCIGPVRCAYCEDSLADEIEHIKPKNFFPQHTFKWKNYLFSCGPCNSPKGSRYGIIESSEVKEFFRRRNDPILPVPDGNSALIDPREEDPLEFLELDLGGVTPDGTEIPGTFELLPNSNANKVSQARAQFTIDVLGLNREIMRVARENAFGGFRARIKEYVTERENGANSRRLGELRRDIIQTPHLTVLAEIIRQKDFLPELKGYFALAPEILEWQLVVSRP